jgi:phosphate transport system substrate-binding protein
MRLRDVRSNFEWNLLWSSVLAFVLLFLVSQSFASTNLINGAGSTFAEPIFSKWSSQFGKQNPNLRVNYQGIGSGAGIRQLTAGTVDFAGTDAVMTEAELKALGKPVAHLPIVIGAVVLSYNLKLSAPLVLDGTTVAAIFDGKIRTWNDPAIQTLNPSLQLPSRPIVVATRSDSSGTTHVFTEYLSQVSPQWNGKNGKTVTWFKGSIGAKGNAGVAGLIKQAEGTIGYIELVYALENKLQMAHLKNAKGKVVEPKVETVSLAASGPVLKTLSQKDFQVSLVNSGVEGAYPIASFTWMLLPEGMPKAKYEAVFNFLNFGLSDEGQKLAAELNYSPLPKAIRASVLERARKISAQ